MKPQIDKFNDECGVFAIYNHNHSAAHTALGLHALQHRGQEAAGIVTFNENKFFSEKGIGHVGDIFSDKKVIEKLPGNFAIGHNRYSTSGETSIRNVQPIFAEFEFGGFALSHNGNLTNARTLRRNLVKQGCIFQSTLDTEIIIHLMATSRHHEVVDRLIDSLRQVEGAYSLVALCNDTIIGVRDPNGVRPLVLGKLENKSWILASETCALDIIGAEYLRDIEPGEIIVQDSSNTSFYLSVFDHGEDFTIEDVTGRDTVFEGQNVQYEAIIQGSNDVIVDWDMGDGTIYEDALKVFHTYQDSGTYEIAIFVFDENNYAEEYFPIYVMNMNPTILNIMMDDTVNEGDQVSFNVQYEDVLMDMDNISVSWIFPDGVFQGNFVQYTFADDGEFLISVEIKDDDGGATMEQRMVIVQNVAPVFTEFALPSEGEQGVAMDFRVSATDPGDDTITYKFDFGDGTAQLITQDGNVSHKYASGDTFEIIICAIDEDGGETCRTEVIPVALLEEIEDSGLPGFGFLGVISALGAITLLRRRTH